MSTAEQTGTHTSTASPQSVVSTSMHTAVSWHDTPHPGYLITDQGSNVQEEPKESTVLYTNSKRPTKFIEHTAILPQYPRTHPSGYTYCINIAGIDWAKRALSRQQKLSRSKAINPKHGTHPLWEPHIQYSWTRLVPQKARQSAYLSNVEGHLFRYKCTGIKCCYFMKPEIAKLQHSFVTNEHWDWQEANRRLLDETEPNILRQNAILACQSINDRWLKKLSCAPFTESCKLVWSWNYYTILDGNHHGFARCINSTPSNNHFFRPYATNHQIDLVLLQQLIEQTSGERRYSLPITQECNVHESTLTRLRHCPASHPQTGSLIHVGCNVEFEYFIPFDYKDSMPYILFTSYGIHEHLPPIPSRPPQDLEFELLELISRAQDGTLSSATLLASSFLEHYLAEKNVTSLAELHVAFSNKSRIRTLIDYSRMTQFPEGRHFAGVQFEWRKDQRNPAQAYIQGIFEDQRGPMIICFHRKQAELLLLQQSFEVDMSFKRVRQRNLNEVLFAALIQEQGTVVTFARAYIVGEDAVVHQTMFERLFQLIQKVVQLPVRWRHLNEGEGFQAVCTDMGSGQLKGLGLYLQSIDPNKRDISWQLQEILIICRIHLRRSIEQIVGTPFSASSPGGHMLSILEAQSRESYFEILEVVGNRYNDSRIYNWCQHKRQLHIAAGLNKHCSNIPGYIWETIRNHTNAVEQSHHKSNSLGTQLDILPAIQRARKLDLRDIDAYHVFRTYGVRSEDRSQNMRQRLNRDMGREKRKSERLLEGSLPSIYDPEYDNLHPTGQLYRKTSYGRLSSSRSTASRGSSRAGSRNSIIPDDSISNVDQSPYTNTMGPPIVPTGNAASSVTSRRTGRQTSRADLQNQTLAERVALQERLAAAEERLAAAAERTLKAKQQLSSFEDRI